MLFRLLGDIPVRLALARDLSDEGPSVPAALAALERLRINYRRNAQEVYVRVCMHRCVWSGRDSLNGVLYHAVVVFTYISILRH